VSRVVLAMAAVDVSRIDRRVRGEVDRRGLFLVSPDPEPGMLQNTHFVFVCTDPDPGDCGFTRVGHVSTPPGVVYAMDGRDRPRQAVSLSQIRGLFPT
jgi:hypothetical protein